MKYLPILIADKLTKSNIKGFGSIWGLAIIDYDNVYVILRTPQIK